MPNKKLIILIALLVGVSLAVVATSPPGIYKNLKVLPRNISSRELNRIMVDEFTDGLGVTCGFCHAEDKLTHKPDYASDEKPEKNMARLMMQMTLGVNKKYFRLKHAAIGDPTLVVSCTTCHNGTPHPNNEASR